MTSDFLIIGAGISGLSTAASIKEKHPLAKVTIIEKGILPTGASTKNAGFACFGSVSELLNDIQTLGTEGMVELVKMRWDGLQKTCQRLGKDNIDIQTKSGYELIFNKSSEIIEKTEVVNNLLFPFFQTTVFNLSNEKIRTFKFNQTSHLIENKLESQLDTGKLISTLWNYCATLGVQIYTGCDVFRIEEDTNEVTAHCSTVKFHAPKVAVCTNAFTHQLFTDKTLDFVPGRGLVMSIIPSNSLAFQGTFHYKEGYYYFRDYYGKLIIGGGRDIAIDKEQTIKFGINNQIKEKLIDDVNQIIIPNQKYTIEMEWSGIMAFGKVKKPIVKKISDRITVGIRLGGMGIAIGSMVGEQVAKLLID